MKSPPRIDSWTCAARLTRGGRALQPDAAVDVVGDSGQQQADDQQRDREAEHEPPERVPRAKKLTSMPNCGSVVPKGVALRHAM